MFNFDELFEKYSAKWEAITIDEKKEEKIDEKKKKVSEKEGCNSGEMPAKEIGVGSETLKKKKDDEEEREDENVDGPEGEPLSEEQITTVTKFKEFFEALSESQKSHIVSLLIGNGVLDKKGDKLVPGKNKDGADAALKKAGIDPKDVSK